MNEIFDCAINKSNEREDNFFIIVFEQLLDYFDNFLHLIFNIQNNTNIIFELENVRDYGKRMLSNYISKNDSSKNLTLQISYKMQIIMSITIQSVFWYKENKNHISRKEATELYKKTLARLH